MSNRDHVAHAIKKPDGKEYSEIVTYMLPAGARKNVVALRQYNYPDFAKVSLLTPSHADRVSALESLLKGYKYDAKREAFKGVMLKELILRHEDKQNTLINLAKILGTAQETEGGMNQKYAGQIIDLELARLHRSPSEAGLMSFSSGQSRRSLYGPDRAPLHYSVEIMHPFSKVRTLQEYKQPASLEGDRITHIGTDHQPLSPLLIAGALREADIYAEPKQFGRDYPLVAQAPANIVAGRLSKHGFIPASIAEEIALRAHALNNGFVSRLQHSNPRTYQGK